jgi:diguanylate cyclase (GGDEF)-like protein
MDFIGLESQEDLRKSEFVQFVVDALSSQVAVLDAAGTVVAVNRAWRERAACADGPLAGCMPGCDYREHCPKRERREGSGGGPELAEEVGALVSGAADRFAGEYPFGAAPTRWFSVRASRFESDSATWVVVEQDEITERKQAELEVEHSRAVYRELATRDELTGVFNRRALDGLLAEEVARHVRYGSMVALVMADIDHFKRVNDEYGHPAGDEALKWLADLLAKNVRVVDKVARYGGEEFAVIAPELNTFECCSMAERLRGLIVSRPFVYRRADGTTVEIPITVSFGVAAIPSDVQDGSSLILAADKALYAAKRCGRNCTVQFRELEEPLVP